MFRRVEIVLDAPVCSCEITNLKWNAGYDHQGKLFLSVWCASCTKTLYVSGENLVGRIRFELTREKGGRMDNLSQNDIDFLRKVKISP